MSSKSIFQKLSETQEDIIYLGIGSSVGNAEEIFKNAEKFLEKNDIKIIKKSKTHQTEPWGGVARNMFSNAAWSIKINSTSFAQRPYKKIIQLLDIIHLCEKQNGRNRSTEKHWGDRPLDIDILWVPGLVCDTKRITLPHPYMAKRSFVLEPLAEIL